MKGTKITTNKQMIFGERVRFGGTLSVGFVKLHIHPHLVSPVSVARVSTTLVTTSQLFCHRLLSSSRYGHVARVNSRDNFAKTTRDQSVKVSEDHHGCIKTLHFGNRVGGYICKEIMAERVKGGRWAWTAVSWKEQGVVGVCEGPSSFLRKFRKNNSERNVPWSLR